MTSLVKMNELRSNERIRLENLSDDELIFESDLALKTSWFHPKYQERASAILVGGKKKLFLKERKVLISFLLISTNQRDKFVEGFNDEALMQAAERILEAGLGKAKFVAISSQILRSAPYRLTERQRKTFYGLLSVSWEDIYKDQKSKREVVA